MLLSRSLGAAFPHPRDGVKVELHTGRTTLTPAWECGTSREPPEVSQPAAIIPHVANRYTAGNPKFALVTSRGYVRLVRVGRQPSSKVAWPRIVRRNGVWMATDDPEEPDPDVLDDIAEQMRLEQELATWIDEPAGPDENHPDEELHPETGPQGPVGPEPDEHASPVRIPAVGAGRVPAGAHLADLPRHLRAAARPLPWH